MPDKVLALSMITRKHVDDLDRCLASCYTVFDEIVVVDTEPGGDPATKAVVEKYKGTYVNFDWVDEFDTARNHGFKQCTSSWIMWLDDDDEIRPQDLLQILQIKEQLPQATYNSVVMWYDYGQDNYGNAVSEHKRHRIVRNDHKHFRWEYPIHEVLLVDQNFQDTDIHIQHKRHHAYSGDRNYRILKKAYEGRYKNDGRIQHYYARECFYKGDHQLVVEIYSKHLYDVPDYTRLGGYYYYAKACFKVGKGTLGLKLCLEAMGKDDRFAEFYCVLGEYYDSIKDYGKSQYWWSKALGKQKPADTWEVFMDDNCYYEPYLQSKLAAVEKKYKDNPTPPPTASESSPTKAPVMHAQEMPGRNDPCPCGSGKKWKKCCGISHNQPTVSQLKVGRNDPCPCGSGKKYKNCCGSNAKQGATATTTIFFLPLHDSASSREWLPKLLTSYGATEAPSMATLCILCNGDNKWVEEVKGVVEKHGIGNVGIVECGSNLGWIGAINHGMQVVFSGQDRPTYVGFMNSDVSFKSGWFNKLSEAVQKSGIGGAGFTGRSYNLGGTKVIGWLEFSCVLFKYKALAYVSSAFFDENTRELKSFSCLDPRFGMGYFEDDDLCLRLLLNNWGLTTVDNSFFEHHTRGSTPDYQEKIRGNYPIFVSKWREHEGQFILQYLQEQRKSLQQICPWVLKKE